MLFPIFIWKTAIKYRDRKSKSKKVKRLESNFCLSTAGCWPCNKCSNLLLLGTRSIEIVAIAICLFCIEFSLKRNENYFRCCNTTLGRWGVIFFLVAQRRPKCGIAVLISFSFISILVLLHLCFRGTTNAQCPFSDRQDVRFLLKCLSSRRFACSSQNGWLVWGRKRLCGIQQVRVSWCVVHNMSVDDWVFLPVSVLFFYVLFLSCNFLGLFGLIFCTPLLHATSIFWIITRWKRELTNKKKTNNNNEKVARHQFQVASQQRRNVIVLKARKIERNAFRAQWFHRKAQQAHQNARQLLQTNNKTYTGNSSKCCCRRSSSSSSFASWLVWYACCCSCWPRRHYHCAKRFFMTDYATPFPECRFPPTSSCCHDNFSTSFVPVSFTLLRPCGGSSVCI